MDSTTAVNIVKNFKNTKILVVGDLMLDEYVWGEVERISPEAPIPILDVKEINSRPGGAANTAHNIKSLGDNNVVLTGVVGSDEKGGILKNLLQKIGIDISGIMTDHRRKTTLKTRVVAKNQQVIRIDTEDRFPLSQEIEDSILNFIGGKIKEVAAVVISDYAKGVVTPTLCQKIIVLARQNNVLSLVDPKGNDYFKYRNCNIIKPNKKLLAEALSIPYEQLNQEGRFLQAGKMLLSHVMADAVLVTLGNEGMILFDRTGNVFRCPAVNKNAIDVSGAGDTALASFALALSCGVNFKDAVVLASHACGVEVGKIGTAVVYPQELEASLVNINYGQN